MDQMKKPAPKHVVEGVCQRLKEIESVEKETGPLLADECRKFIYAREEITWMDILISAYYLNGGVMLREAFAADENCELGREKHFMEGPHGPSNSPKHAPVDVVPVLASEKRIENGREEEEQDNSLESIEALIASMEMEEERRLECGKDCSNLLQRQTSGL